MRTSTQDRPVLNLSQDELRNKTSSKTAYEFFLFQQVEANMANDADSDLRGAIFRSFC